MGTKTVQAVAKSPLDDRGAHLFMQTVSACKRAADYFFLKLRAGLMNAAAATLIFVLMSEIVTGGRIDILPDRLPTRYRTQGRFTAALQQPISATWKGVSLRTILRRLSRDGQVAILIDRRVDPSREVVIDTADRSLRSVVDEIARLSNLSATQVGNCLVMAPAAAALRLRTLVALREEEQSVRNAGDRSRASRMRFSRATVVWNDLDRPADIVSAIGKRFGLSIDGIENIPHDLWAGAVIPEATAAEALSLILNQFDMTFEWKAQEAGVRLVSLPAKVAIERTYPLPGSYSVSGNHYLSGKSAGQTLELLQAKILGLSAEVRDGKLVVRGTVEQHEAVASALGLADGIVRKAPKTASVPLEKRSFTLQVQGIDLITLLEALKRKGIAIQYNADALRKSGVDLDRKISLDLPELSAHQFFKRLLDPYGLTFRFEQDTVFLEQKSQGP